MSKSNRKGFCITCEKESIFSPTISPKGYWICSGCGRRTSKIDKILDLIQNDLKGGL